MPLCLETEEAKNKFWEWTGNGWQQVLEPLFYDFVSKFCGWHSNIIFVVVVVIEVKCNTPYSQMADTQEKTGA